MSNMRAFACLFFLAFAAQATQNTTGTTMTSETTQTSHTTATSSQSTSSTESTPSTEPSTTSTTSTMEVNTTTPEEATGLVEGTLSFVVTSGNASDLVDAFENDEDGSVAIALATSIAAGADGVSQENVTIASMSLMGPSPAERRVQAMYFRSTRALTLSESVNQSILVEFTIAFFGSDGPVNAEEVSAALISDEGISAIESSLPTELQAIDPSLTIAEIAVSAVATTGTTTNNEVANFAAGPSSWHSCVVLACSIASLLLQ